ncbi:hypothetical protein PG984_008106 [Apiospora sp. TS-2023a]
MGLPPDGPIKIGNVLASIKTPESPLHTAPLPADHEVFSTEKRQVEFSYEKLREGRFSILTKFLSFLGVGVYVGIERSKGLLLGEEASRSRLTGLSGAGGAVPVSGGPGIAGSVSRREVTSWKESSDFVLAYRVRKVMSRKSGPVKSSDDYTKGAMLGNEEVDIQTQGFDILVEDTDVSQGEEEFTPEEVMDGDDSIICCLAK